MMYTAAVFQERSEWTGVLTVLSILEVAESLLSKIVFHMNRFSRKLRLKQNN